MPSLRSGAVDTQSINPMNRSTSAVRRRDMGRREMRALLPATRINNGIHAVGVSVVTGIAAVVLAPLARAADSVTYEVISDSIAAADVEYFDHSERQALQHVALPWRITVAVLDAVKPTRDGSEIRADWRQYGRWRDKYVTARIYFRDSVLCESTLDVGDATCNGSVPHTNFPETGGI
jgi:hypothetical protein